ncbi:MAG: hypothetical protein HKN23_12635 [Verrucomicrobiales bacterium]|nr:hypothetical protein [Verrucomicrobiales bacterium]
MAEKNDTGQAGHGGSAGHNLGWVRKTFWVPVWIFVTGIVYLVSPVFLYFLDWVGVPKEGLFNSDLLDRVYRPLEVLYDQSKWYAAFIDWAENLFDY